MFLRNPLISLSLLVGLLAVKPNEAENSEYSDSGHHHDIFEVFLGNTYVDSDDEFLLLTGVGNEFELSEKWVMFPEFNVDFVDGEESFAYGISLGFGF